MSDALSRKVQSVTVTSVPSSIRRPPPKEPSPSKNRHPSIVALDPLRTRIPRWLWPPSKAMSVTVTLALFSISRAAADVAAPHHPRAPDEGHIHRTIDSFDVGSRLQQDPIAGVGHRHRIGDGGSIDGDDQVGPVGRK